MSEVKLTRYRHGSGCGCKISHKVLDSIVKSSLFVPADEKLLVGNKTRNSTNTLNAEESPQNNYSITRTLESTNSLIHCISKKT